MSSNRHCHRGIPDPFETPAPRTSTKPSLAYVLPNCSHARSWSFMVIFLRCTDRVEWPMAARHTESSPDLYGRSSDCLMCAIDLPRRPQPGRDRALQPRLAERGVLAGAVDAPRRRDDQIV